VSFEATALSALIASPSDVSVERSIIAKAIHDWNNTNAELFGIFLVPVMWETHSTPAMGEPPQAVLNKQIVDRCDFLIGIFWTRIGTPTGVAASGTVEEIERFIAAGKPVLLYFSSRPVALDSVDHEQYQRLKHFRKSCEARGLVERYSSESELVEKLSRHLTLTVQRDFLKYFRLSWKS
jgi:hypothetical protein